MTLPAALRPAPYVWPKMDWGFSGRYPMGLWAVSVFRTDTLILHADPESPNQNTVTLPIWPAR